MYFVLNAEFNVYMDIQQAINLHILRRFIPEGIEFADPATTVQARQVRAARRGGLSVVTEDAINGTAT